MPDSPAKRRPLVVVMGVAGSGKSTVGPLVAGRLAVPFVDGDDFHSDASIERTRVGRPLGDAARGPWPDRLHHVPGGPPARGCGSGLLDSQLATFERGPDLVAVDADRPAAVVAAAVVAVVEASRT